jgi:hypothetical protein
VAQRVLQQSNHNYHPKTIPRQEEVSHMTPSLSKTNRSFATEEVCNASFMTEKQRGGKSEHGSISASSKNSFNDSFQLYQQDLSYE